MKKKPLDVSGRAQRTPPSVAIAQEPAGLNRVRGPEGKRRARRGRVERTVEWFEGNGHGD